MNASPLVWKTLRDLRGATIAIGVSNFLMAVLVVAIYPSYAEQLAGIDFPAVYEAFFGEAPISSPEGFASAEFFSWIPLLLITLAIIGGTAAIAGEEAAGTADALLALPVKRRDVLLAKATGNAIAIVLVSIIAYPGFAIAALFVDFPISWTNLWWATLAMLPVSFVYLTIALWGSAALPWRGAAAIVTIAAVVVAYFLNTVGAAVADLEVVRKLSPFYWSDSSAVLVHGFQLWRTLGLLAVSAAALFLATRAVEARDIGSRRNWTLPIRLRLRPPDDAVKAAGTRPEHVRR